MGSDNVPDELLDRILQHVAPPPLAMYDEDQRAFVTSLRKPNLLAASRVSRRWRACSIPYLFRDIVMQHYPDVEADFAGVLRGLGNHLQGRKTVRGLLQFLRTHLSICPHVQQLSIRPAFSCPDDMTTHTMSWGLFTACEVVETDLLLSIVDHLPCLKVLALIDLSWSMPKTKRATSAAVDTLYVSDTDSCLNMYTPLVGFSTVKNLHILVSQPGDGLHPGRPQKLANPIADSLFTHGDVSLSVFRDMYEPRRSLRSLSLGQAFQDETVRQISLFLDGTAEYLVDLSCCLSVLEYGGSWLPSEMNISAVISRSANIVLAQEYIRAFERHTWIQLRKLTFTFYTGAPASYVGQSGNDGIWEYVANLLGVFTNCPVLESVGLVIKCKKGSGGFRPYMHKVEKVAVLESILLRFPALKTVALSQGINAPNFSPAQHQFFETALSELTRRGLLRT